MWEINITNQIANFLLSICFGVILCIVYDFIRALRTLLFKSFLSVFVWDVFYWALSAVLTFIFLLSRTKGEIRGYVLIGGLLGFMLFRVTLSVLWYKLLCFIITTFIKVNSTVRHKLSVIYTVIYKFISDQTKKLNQNIKSYLKKFKKLLKSAGKLLYTNKNIETTEKSLDEAKTKT